MAKKKRGWGDDSPGKRRKNPPPQMPPDLRAMEGVMRQFVSELGGGAGQDTPLGRATALVQQAFGERDPGRRLQLAAEALAICPDCADAYVIQAELAPNRKAALKLYEAGMAAGERALGAAAFKRDAGHFWGILETRPYMRARLGLAHVLWTSGRRDEAVQHLRDMLRLNPGDNQGVRYTLASFLLFLDRDADLARLLEQYPDEGSVEWAYTRALLAFRQHGDTIDARRLLKQARKVNKYVLPYLTGEKFPAAGRARFYRPGGQEEALNYVDSFMAGWKDTAGAIAWLRENAPAKKSKARPSAKGPLVLIKNWLNKNLPLRDDVWQAASRPMPTWIRVGGKPVRFVAGLVLSISDDLVLAHDLFEEAPDSNRLWDTLLQAMQHPAAGVPHRPAEIQVRPGEGWDELRTHLEEIGVRLTVTEDLPQVGIVFLDMCSRVGGNPPPGLLDVPGVTPARVGSLYEAAAYFFRQAPWKKVGFESAIKVECDKFQSGPWYAVLMGQSGLTAGLALYEDLEELRQLLSGDGSDESTARRTVATTITFGEEWTIPVADLDAAKQHGWQVARPDAYPEVFHKERGMSVRPPLAWELELMEACLRAVPDFVTRRTQTDPTAEEVTVPAAGGQLKLGLSWVVDEDA
jgi:hypothetical protein